MDLQLQSREKALLGSGLRIDSRKFGDSREIKLTTSRVDNYITVELGKTVVSGEIQAATIVPSPKQPNRGKLSICFVQSDLVYFPAKQKSVSTPKHELCEIQNTLQQLITESSAIHLESLCIIRGKKVFFLKLFLRLHQHDGALLDACSVLVIALIQSFRQMSAKTNCFFSLLNQPYFVTLGVFCGQTKRNETEQPETGECFEEQLVFDPTYSETLACISNISIGTNKEGDIYAIQLKGRDATLPAIFDVATANTKKRTQYYTNQIALFIEQNYQLLRNER